jgi:hypothetical protein
MVRTLKLAFAGAMVAVALLTANFSMGSTPSAEAQSPYCVVNGPTVCTPAFCATYPQLCNMPVNPIYPVNPCGVYVYGCGNPCGVYGCVNNPYTCAPVPFSPIYGYQYRSCAPYYPIVHPQLPGPPARVNLSVSPAIATCASTPVTVSANITDALGVPVANGTHVAFSSTIGSVGSATTIGGNATATLTIPSGSASGIAQIRVTAGGASSTTTVQVNCAPAVVVQQQVVVARPAQATVIYQPAPTRPAPQVIIQRAPAPMPAPPFAPPRTGEAGLTDWLLAEFDDSDANQALVDALHESEYGVLDASQYDWVVTPDDSAATTTLAIDLLSQAYSVSDAAQADVVVESDDAAATTTLVTQVLSEPTE